MKYLSKYGKVWQKITTKETFGRNLELKDGETLAMYKQVPDPELKSARQKNEEKQTDNKGGV